MTELTYLKMENYIRALESIKDEKVPFKLGIAIAKDLRLLKTEEEVYLEAERKFAKDYLVIDEATGDFKQVGPNRFEIKEGLQEECEKARKEIDEYTFELDLIKLKASDLEKLNLSSAQIEALYDLIEEE